MADNEHNGTEAPTPRRRDEARGEGQVVISPDLTAAVALLTGCMILLWTGSTLAARLLGGFREWFTEVPQSEWTQWHISLGARWLSTELIGVCGLLVAGLMTVGLAFGFAQVGFVVSLKPLAMNWSRILPENGWSRLLSLESGVRGLLSVLKVSLLLSITALLLWMRRQELSIHNFRSVADVAAFGWRLGLIVCLAMAGVSVGLALIDYLVKWFQNEKKLKMTREEIKQEQKDDQGDPQELHGTPPPPRGSQRQGATIRRVSRTQRLGPSIRTSPSITAPFSNVTSPRTLRRRARIRLGGPWGVRASSWSTRLKNA